MPNELCGGIQESEFCRRAELFVRRDFENGHDIAAAQALLLTLGCPKRNPAVVRRYVFFLASAIKRYVWTWESMGCDLPGPSQVIVAIESWLEDGIIDEELMSACIPLIPKIDGLPIDDCDSPALNELATAASRLAYFCCTNQLIDAALVLVSLEGAALENLQANDGITFEDWLVLQNP